MRISFICDTPIKRTILEKWCIEAKVKWIDGKSIKKNDLNDADSIDFGYRGNEKTITQSLSPYGRNLSDYVFDIYDKNSIAFLLNLEEKSKYITIDQKLFTKIIKLIHKNQTYEISSLLEGG